MEECIGLMYLAEQTSPDDYELKNLDIINKCGVMWAVFEAVLHSFDVLNRNRRMYDGQNTWQCIASNERIQDGIKKKGWYGEQDHPGQDFTNMALTAERVQKIDMNNRSHAIINPHLKNNLLVSTIETCPGTICGDGMAKDIIRGLIPSFSCRSIAIMKYRDGKPYVEIKKVITYDWVLYPSHREAQMISKPTITNGRQKILLESAEGYFETSFNKYSEDICIPFSEFNTIKDKIITTDKNVGTVLESFDDGAIDIIGFDPATKDVIIESGKNKMFIKTNMETKRKVEDFLLSIR